MTPIPDDTLERLHELAREQQRARQKQQMVLQTLLEAKGLDPDTHQVDLQEGVIREADSE